MRADAALVRISQPQVFPLKPPESCVTITTTHSFPRPEVNCGGCRPTVSNLGGSVSCSGILNQLSCTTGPKSIMSPLPTPDTPSPCLERREPPDARTWRILVVEDDQDTVETMSLLLRYHG